MGGEVTRTRSGVEESTKPQDFGEFVSGNVSSLRQSCFLPTCPSLILECRVTAVEGRNERQELRDLITILRRDVDLDQRMVSFASTGVGRSASSVLTVPAVAGVAGTPSAVVEAGASSSSITTISPILGVTPAPVIARLRTGALY